MAHPPRWTDDLFPFPTPSALAVLVDIAWENSFIDDDYYDECLAATYFDFMFDLEAVPATPDGYDGMEDTGPRPAPFVPLWATPESVPFGHLGTGTHVGWVILAPELGAGDHPVALIGGDDGGDGVRVIGADTRAGLTFMLSTALRRKRLGDADRAIVDRVAAALGVRPSPQFGVTADGRDALVPLDPAVPPGWRYEPGASGVGVLAPADAFTDRGPIDGDLEPLLDDTAALLDAGHPATALAQVIEAFHVETARFADLRPLWDRAYRDLGRPWHAERLAPMEPMYPPHRDAPPRRPTGNTSGIAASLTRRRPEPTPRSPARRAPSPSGPRPTPPPDPPPADRR